MGKKAVVIVAVVSLALGVFWFFSKYKIVGFKSNSAAEQSINRINQANLEYTERCYESGMSHKACHRFYKLIKKCEADANKCGELIKKIQEATLTL